MWERLSVTFPGTRTVSYGYDDASRCTSITYPVGVDQATCAYHNANRLSSVTDWNSQATRYAYDDANRMTTTTLPSSTGAVIEHDREAAGDVPGEGGSAAAGGTAVAQAVAAVGKGNLENLEGWLPASRDDGNWFERSWNSVKDKVNNIPPPPDNIWWNNPDSWTIPVPGVPPVIPVPIP